MIVNLGVDEPERIPIRDAATVMLVRDAPLGLEVFMLRRNLQSDFVGGAYVFPGGAVDPEDGDIRVESICDGRTDASASSLLGIERGGLAFWVAAVRESFEEAGLLLATDGAGAALRFDDPHLNDRFVEHRRAVDSCERALVDICVEESLQLSVGRIHYFSRWVTPLGAPRRYDTRFFVAHPPEGQEPVHDDREVIANLWIRPEDALARHAAGEFELIFPTVRSLEALALFDTADSVLAHTAAMGDIRPVVPTIVDGEHGLRIVLPGDGVYDAITSRRVGDLDDRPV